jgi:CRP-like cAMP-binding protein
MMPGGVKGTMARDVVKLVYKDLHNLVKAERLFRGIGEMALTDLLIKLEPEQYTGPCPDPHRRSGARTVSVRSIDVDDKYGMGEVIVKAGDLATDLYIIVSGWCSLTTDNDKIPPLLLGPGCETSMFGERAALGQGDGEDGTVSTYTVRAKGSPFPEGLSDAEKAPLSYMQLASDPAHASSSISAKTNVTRVRVLLAPDVTIGLRATGVNR